MNIPKDPFILLSFINMKLRDHYSTLEELCQIVGADPDDIREKLNAIGYTYDPEQNQFK